MSNNSAPPEAPAPTTLVHEHSRRVSSKRKTSKWFEDAYSERLAEVGIAVVRGKTRPANTRITLVTTQGETLLTEALTLDAEQWTEGYLVGIKRVPVWNMEPVPASGLSDEDIERLAGAMAPKVADAILNTPFSVGGMDLTPPPRLQGVEVYVSLIEGGAAIVSRAPFPGAALWKFDVREPWLAEVPDNVPKVLEEGISITFEFPGVGQQ
ncbi:MAG TPA: hypothetical protein VM285_03075 [Polyangia bacterium]|nr:hypothetical protein [Polyangia bacterium]